jgi:hypothetical protein
MKITYDTKLAEILGARPDLRWTLVEQGIDGLADESHFPPPQRTVAEAASRHGANADAMVGALNGAWQAGPDEARIAAVKAKFPAHKHQCCCGH